MEFMHWQVCTQQLSSQAVDSPYKSKSVPILSINLMPEEPGEKNKAQDDMIMEKETTLLVRV